MPEVTESPEVVTPEQELADFKSGFNDETPTETPAHVESAKVDEAAPAEEAPRLKEITEDEYNKLLASAAAVDELRATHTKKLDDAFGRIGGLAQTLKNIQSTPAGQAAEISLDDLSALKDYGDELPTALAASLNKALAKVKVSGPAFDEASLEPVVQKRVSEALERVQKERQAEAEETVAEVHPDFKAVFADDGFAAWRQSLPDDRRTKLENTWNPTIITKAITDYKASKVQKVAPKQETPNNRKALLEAAVTPKGTSAATPGKKTEMDEFMEGFRS